MPIDRNIHNDFIRPHVPKDTIVMWKFCCAPPAILALVGVSPFGGDEDYIAVRRKDAFFGYVPFFDNDVDSWFGCCAIEEYDTDEFEIRVGGHA